MMTKANIVKQQSLSTDGKTPNSISGSLGWCGSSGGRTCDFWSGGDGLDYSS